MQHQFAPGIVLLFGAGASAFGPGIVPNNPPLGANLFVALQSHYPFTWGLLFSEAARAAFAESFEAGMSHLWHVYPNAMCKSLPGVPCPAKAMRDVARYFLQYRLDESQSDLYSQLVMAFERRSLIGDVGFCTLNYETLLSHALRMHGCKPRVLHLHGRVDQWIRSRAKLRVGPSGAVGAGMHVVSRRVSQMSSRTANDRLAVAAQGLYPPMSLYMPNKPAQVGAEYLTRMHVRFARRVASAKALFLVGVRPWPGDTHIWGPIAAARCPVFGVTGRREFDTWTKNARPSHKSVWLGDQFGACIESIVEESARAMSSHGNRVASGNHMSVVSPTSHVTQRVAAAHT